MERVLDKKDAYLYGTLLALVRPHLAAIEKRVNGGGLGLWGKIRFGSRNKAIQKYVFKILQRKQSSIGDKALAEMAADLDFIEEDNHVWDDITAEELKYVRTVLRGLS